jgi:hypothetical protein
MFHGRRDILDKLQAYFSRDIGMRHISLLHGLGGAGKTQICLKFLAESDKSRCDLSCTTYLVASSNSLHRFTDVFFLDASTVDTINSGLKNIALTQSLGSEVDDASHWLASSQDEWLLIFDNADDPSINLFHYFPQSSSGNILITSRNPQLYVHAPDSHHHITDMDEEDAVRLLLASAIQPSISETENLARDIVKVFTLHILHYYFLILPRPSTVSPLQLSKRVHLLQELGLSENTLHFISKIVPSF